MRIGFDGRYIQDRYHGIGRYAFELLSQLLTLESQNTYVVLWSPHQANRRFDLERLLNHPRVEPIQVHLPLYSVRDQAVLPLLARQRRLDVYHVPYFAAPLLVPCPLVVSIHDLIFERYPQFMPRRWARIGYGTFMALCLRRASRVITGSAATGHDLVDHYGLPLGKILVTPYAADGRFQRSNSEEIRAVRQRYHLPSDFILSVGARRPHKNIAAAVRALGHIRDRVPHTLVLVGEGDVHFRDIVPALIEQMGLRDRVLCIDKVEDGDLPAIYSAAAAYVCPSLIEGFGLPALESLSCGTPVVASNRSSLPDVVGAGGLLVDPTDEVALSTALIRVLTEPGLAETLQKQALAQATLFSWRETAAQTLRLYQTLDRRS